MKMTLVNSRGGKAAKGAKGYLNKVKANALPTTKAVGIVGVAMAAGMLGSQYGADKIFGNKEDATAEENAKSKRTGQLIMRGGALALGILLAPVSAPLGLGVALAGAVGLGRAAVGAIDKEEKILGFTQEGLERDYGGSIEDEIAKKQEEIVASMRGPETSTSAPGMAGLNRVNVSDTSVSEMVSIS